MNILFTNVGRRTYLVEHALTLKKQGLLTEIYVSDTNVNTAGFHIAEDLNYFLTPRVSGNEEEYVELLLVKCKEKKIDILIPLMDFELLILAQNKHRFEELGCRVIVSSEEVINNTLNKKYNYNFNTENCIATPLSYFSTDNILNISSFVKKRINGSGSVGLSFHKSKESLIDFIESVDMIQEMVDGQEYGIDIFNDLNGNFVHTCAKKKISMRSGETDKAEVVYDKRLVEFAKMISQKYKHVGNMDVDVIIDANDKIWCIDMNPRFGGGYPFTYHSGFNYLLYLINMINGNQIEIPKTQKNIIGMKGVKMYYYEKK